VSVIKGYRLVCEVCGNKSNYVLENYADPETHNHSYYNAYTGTYDNPMCNLNPDYPYPVGWKKIRVTRTFQTGKWPFKKEERESKYIFFCTQDHFDKWKLIRDVSNSEWK
jgi:hypothetical protein